MVTKVVKAKISDHVKETCQGSFTVSHLTPLEDWLDQVVMRWIRMIHCSTTSLSSAEQEETTLVLKSFQQQLCHFLYETYTRTRIDQLFNIIIEFLSLSKLRERLRQKLV